MEEGRASPISKYFNIYIGISPYRHGARDSVKDPGWGFVLTPLAFLAEKSIPPLVWSCLSHVLQTDVAQEWRPRRGSRYNRHLTTSKAKAEVNGDNLRELDKHVCAGVSD